MLMISLLETSPSAPRKIINNHHDVFSTTIGSYSQRTRQIHMEKLKRSYCGEMLILFYVDSYTTNPTKKDDKHDQVEKRWKEDLLYS